MVSPTAVLRAGVRRRVATCNIQGLVPYGAAWKLQQGLVAQRIAWQKENRPGYDAMLVLEHKPVYTLGRSAKPADVKFPLDAPEQGNEATHGCEVYKTDRGGQVTWHGAGQVVVYPIIDLTHHKKDLRWYVRGLEEVVIRVLSRYNIKAQRDKEHTGVWVKDGTTKIAAIGVSASRWITCHGLALNVDPDLTAFEQIVPCGIQDRSVGSLKQLLPPEEAKEVTTARVRYELMETFEEVFPSIELCVQECKALPTGVEEVVCVGEEEEGEGEPELARGGG